VVILNVLLSIYCFLHKCSISGAHNLKKKNNQTNEKIKHFCAETFCSVYHQNTTFSKFINGYLDISCVLSLMPHFILIPF